MPTTPALACYRALSRLLPRGFRDEAGPELEAAAAACVARERARLGRIGVAIAALRITTDTLANAVALRLDDDRTGFRNTYAGPPRGIFEALMDNLKKDLLYAIRGFRRQPGFFLLTVMTLALGIGANTAIFSVVNGVLLRPLPYPNSEQLEYITTKFPGLGFQQFWVSPPEVLELAAHNSSFSSVGGFSAGSVTLNTERPSRPVSGLVTPGLMETLAVPPYMGRWFNEQDSRVGAEDTAILSWELWNREYGRRADILGQKILVNNVSTTVVGVMPRGYDVHDQKIEIWIPLTIDPAQLATRRGNHFLYVVARRKDGVSPAAARADLMQMQTHWVDFAPSGAGHIFRLDPPDAKQPANHVLRIDPLKADIIGGARTALLVLQGAVGFVLLIACANLANLLLARAESRQREFAVRTALGAARSRLFSQFVVEGLLLSLIAAVVGVGLAWLALRGLLQINPDAIPRSAEVSLDWKVLVFTLLLAVGTAFVFGLAPLFSISRRLITTLRDGTRATGGRVQKLVRGSLVVAEVTLAVMLVAGAGLLVKSLSNLMNVDAGFNRSQLVTFGVVLPGATYNPQQRVDFMSRLEEGLSRVPGVTAVASMSGLPPNRAVNANDTDFEHIPNVPNQDPSIPGQNTDYWQQVTQKYTQTMGIPVLQGRGFETGDVTGPPVVLVNEALVKRFFTPFKRDAIGAKLKRGFGDTQPWFTIVGVLKDVKQGGVAEPTGTEIYFLTEQLPRLQQGAPGSMNIVMRTSQPMSTLAPAIAKTVGALDATMPIVKLRTMDDVFGDSVSRPRFITLLLGIFAGLALVLAAIGTYGVLSYLVNQQAQEIGIRIALGASRNNVLSLVLGKGLTLTAIGLVLGVAGALALGKYMRTLLFAVSPTDPITLGAVVVVMALVAVAACLVPALRATKVDPINTLRT